MIKGLLDTETGKFVNLDFQSGFCSVAQACRVLNIKQAPHYKLVDVSVSDIHKLMPVDKTELLTAVDDLLKRVAKLEGKL